MTADHSTPNSGNPDSGATAEDFVTLARIVRPQGRRGEVLADLLTDFPEQFSTAGVTLLLPTGRRTPVTVENHWLPVGRNAGRIVLKLAGTDSISDAETLAGASVQLPRHLRLTPDSGTYYIDSLVGCAMVQGETTLGTVEDLHFPTNPDGRPIPDAAAIFVVRRHDGDELLIPFANEFIQSIDTGARRIEVRLPQGLVDING